MTDIKDNLTIKIKSGITVGELRDILGSLTDNIDDCVIEQDVQQYYNPLISRWTLDDGLSSYPASHIYCNCNNCSDED